MMAALYNDCARRFAPHTNKEWARFLALQYLFMQAAMKNVSSPSSTFQIPLRASVLLSLMPAIPCVLIPSFFSSLRYNNDAIVISRRYIPWIKMVSTALMIGFFRKMPIDVVTSIITLMAIEAALPHINARLPNINARLRLLIPTPDGVRKFAFMFPILQILYCVYASEDRMLSLVLMVPFLICIATVALYYQSASNLGAGLARRVDLFTNAEAVGLRREGGGGIAQVAALREEALREEEDFEPSSYSNQ